jgi:hypothetical protein
MDGRAAILSTWRVAHEPHAFAVAFLVTVAAAAAPTAVPVTGTVHGITLTDEYRWMEDPAKPGRLG